MLQRSLSGQFQVKVLRPDTWCATNQEAPGQSLLLRRIETTDPLQTPGVAQRISVTWHGSSPVSVAFTRDEQTVTVVAGAVFLNEPAGPIYAGLALPAFTSSMRRFWRRVFRLVSLPGGRWVVGWLSRRRRGRAT